MFYTSPDAALVWLLPWTDGDADPHLTGFCAEFVQPGHVVWDIGGNVGLFAFSAAHRAGARGFVLTVEPDPFLSQLLLRTENERPDSSAPCTILTAAVSREAGFATLEVPVRGRAANALAGKSDCTQRGGIRGSFEVPVITLDQLAEKYPLPDVMKMDVEGSESDVLAGGKRFFERARPVIYVEVQKRNAEEIVGFLRTRDYVLQDPTVPAARRSELATPGYNILAIPRSHAAAGKAPRPIDAAA